MTTEAEVIEGTLKFFSKPGTFTPEVYFETPDGSGADLGEEIGAACAVGGIEHTIFQMTGKAMHGSNYTKPDRRSLYGRVFVAVNDVTRRLYPKSEDGGENVTIEDITFYGTPLAAKRRVLKVLRTALAELS